MKEFGKKYDHTIESLYQHKLGPQVKKKPSSIASSRNSKKKKQSDSGTFCICLPPPNVTGVLHLGHALTIAIEDALVRYHLLQGDDVAYVPGTDHAGISTQVKVEEKIAKRWVDKQQLGREKFMWELWNFALDNRSTIIKQLEMMWAHLDRSKENFTLSPKCSRAVRKSFSNLYQQKKIYQWSYINNRCMRCQTVLSDVEVTHKTQESILYYLDYFCVGRNNEKLTIATTRPETIFADVALAVHPEDSRYQKFVGTKVVVPYSQHVITVIADEAVDPNYGTGVLKVTPFHDPLDYEIGVRHNLILDRCAITKEGILTDICGQFANRHIDECYEILVNNLLETHIIKTESIQNNISCCERCQTKIQPLITTQRFVDVREYASQVLEKVADHSLQIHPPKFADSLDKRLGDIKPWCISRQLRWGHRIPIWHGKKQQYILDEDFVLQMRSSKINSRKISEKGKKLNQYCILSLVLFNCIADGRITNGSTLESVIESLTQPSIVPNEWSIRNTYYQAYKIKFQKDKRMLKELDMLHPILNLDLQSSQQAIDMEQSLEDIIRQSYCLDMDQNRIFFDFEWLVWEPVEQDPDVLDTWFSSALWPFSTLWWPDQTPDFAQYYPNSIIETWYDIVFFWVARMLMMGIANTGVLPFHTIYLHGLVRDEKGRKMSKTLGNGIDPVDLINKYGADALRMSLIMGTTPWGDINYAYTRIEYASRFINKFWNAARFVYTNVWLWSTKIDLELLADDIMTHSDKLEAFDQRILDKTHTLIQNTTQWFQTYTFGESYTTIIKTIWNDFCDWMIEVSKIEKSMYTDKVMIYCIGVYLKLLHPIIPFVTNHLRRMMSFTWFVYDRGWPTGIVVKSESDNINLLIETIWQLRMMKQQIGSKHHEEVAIFIQSYSNYYRFITKYETVVEKLLRTQNITYLIDTQEQPSGYTVATVQHVTVGIQEVYTTNHKEEYQKLLIELEDETQYKDTLETTLASSSFRANAPTPVVSEKQKKLEEVKHKITTLNVEIQKYKMKYSNL